MWVETSYTDIVSEMGCEIVNFATRFANLSRTPRTTGHQDHWIDPCLYPPFGDGLIGVTRGPGDASVRVVAFVRVFVRRVEHSFCSRFARLVSLRAPRFGAGDGRLAYIRLKHGSGRQSRSSANLNSDNEPNQIHCANSVSCRRIPSCVTKSQRPRCRHMGRRRRGLRHGHRLPPDDREVDRRLR